MASARPNNVLITGATGGIGRGLAEALVRAGDNVYVTGKSAERLEKLVDALKDERRRGDQTIESFRFDIGHIDDVKRAMVDICKIEFDTVIFNAGVMFPPKPPAEDSKGDDAAPRPLREYEETIKINVLGHFCMASLLLRARRPGQQLKFVCVSSNTARVVKYCSVWPSSVAGFEKFFRGDQYFADGWASYFHSKLAVIVMAQHLNKLPNVGALAIHPGVASTGMFDSIPALQRLLLRPVKWFQKIDGVEVCADRVIREGVAAAGEGDFWDDNWICEGRQATPVPLTLGQRQALIDFLTRLCALPPRATAAAEFAAAAAAAARVEASEESEEEEGEDAPVMVDEPAASELDRAKNGLPPAFSLLEKGAI